MKLSGTIRLTGKQYSFRNGSARDLRWTELQKWEGRSIEDWIQAMSARSSSKQEMGQYRKSSVPPSVHFRLFQRQGLVTVSADEGTASDGSAWADTELRDAVEAYCDMREKSANGKSFIKARYFERLAIRHGRTIKAFEYRMQNISSVLANMGIDWIPGLPPAKNVGRNVAERIEKIIREGSYFQRQIYEPIADPEKLAKRAAEIRCRGMTSKPKGTKNPRRSSLATERIDRNPDVVAWVLDVANGTCECCEQSAPFIRQEDRTGYLEVHHAKTLSDGGSDTPENAVALCPNCHRELHYGVNATALIERLYNRISRLIRE